MVEFGLKLEDNKVSEWSDNYLDYEGLKKILKKAKKAQKKYEETCSENPQEAKQVTDAYRSGEFLPEAGRSATKLFKETPELEEESEDEEAEENGEDLDRKDAENEEDEDMNSEEEEGKAGFIVSDGHLSVCEYEFDDENEPDEKKKLQDI